jgi:FtsP/CotA-like multicopper oxidase with cupredoxin domain
MKNQLLLLLFTLFFCQNVIAQNNNSEHSNHSTQEIKDKIKDKIKNKTVVYYLNVNDTVMEMAGKKANLLTTNGQIPAPTLFFTEGDTALIYVKNNTKGTTSFHWHGLLLPNEQDGVPLLTTELIKAGDTHIFKFPIIQNGTYWYHSHTMFQEQKGLYGGISIAPKEPQDFIRTKEKVIVLSDFTDQNPHNVLRLLKRHTDWYAIKRNAIQSYGRAIATGNLSAKAWLEWKRMPDMDLADVYYDAFLANGKIKEEVENLKAGETIRLRVINGSSSSHFWLHYAGGKMKIVAADGINVEPIEVDKLLIATAETYDIEVTIPQNSTNNNENDKQNKYEFRATSWDRYKYTSVWLGDKSATEKAATDLPPLDYFALVNEMKDMMKMMPKMKMGKAPKNRMEDGFYANGKAPTNQDILMEDMKRMGMKMGNGNEGMGHGEMKMENGEMKMSEENGDEGMENGEMKMNHDKMKMDSSKMDKMQEGKTHDASKEGMIMNKNNSMVKSMLKPMGVMMTGYKQLKKQNPNETIFDYTMLKSQTSTKIASTKIDGIDKDKPVRIIHLYLGGNMLRYVWMINNTPLSEADKIKITKGETVRFVMHNTTMMSHPMHLHGHFFRVINGQGDFAPLKHTLNVAPMETTIIEFDAIEEKDWFFHCHLLYHMVSGMARVVSYSNSTPMITTNSGYRRFAREDKKWYSMANARIQSNGLWADASIFNFRNEISIEGNTNYEEFEIEAKAMHYFGPKQFFIAYLGTEIEQEEIDRTNDNQDPTEMKVKGLVGIRYFLPMHVWSDFRTDHEGNLQVELEREDFPLTKRWRANAGVTYLINQDEFRYTIGTSYILGQYFGISANYDNRYGWGAGLQIMY